MSNSWINTKEIFDISDLKVCKVFLIVRKILFLYLCFFRKLWSSLIDRETNLRRVKASVLIKKDKDSGFVKRTTRETKWIINQYRIGSVYLCSTSVCKAVLMTNEQGGNSGLLYFKLLWSTLSYFTRILSYFTGTLSYFLRILSYITGTLSYFDYFMSQKQDTFVLFLGTIPINRTLLFCFWESFP